MRVEESLKTEIEKKHNFQEHLDKFQLPFKLLLQKDLGLDSDVDQEQYEIDARNGDAKARMKIKEKAMSKKVD